MQTTEVSTKIARTIAAATVVLGLVVGSTGASQAWETLIGTLFGGAKCVATGQAPLQRREGEVVTTGEVKTITTRYPDPANGHWLRIG